MCKNLLCNKLYTQTYKITSSYDYEAQKIKDLNKLAYIVLLVQED